MKIIEWIKSILNKKYNTSQKCISDEELKQKKEQFQIRKQAIDEYLNTLVLQFDNKPQKLNNVALRVLDISDTAIRKLNRFNKYDLTNPCMTYEEHHNVVITEYRTLIANISENVFNIPIEILVYYVLGEPYLHQMLNNCTNSEYQRYCGMFKNDIVILLVNLGFKSMFD
jgi:hypothetical protein